MKIITAKFFRNASGNQPVRDWLLEFTKDDKLIIGQDIKTVEFGWPIGMPVCKPLGTGLYEIRSNLSSNRVSRIFFCIIKNEMVLLHGFIKKSQKAPDKEIDIARKLLKEITHG